MKVNITSRHLEITDGIRKHLDDKIKKISLHHSDLERIEVVLSVQGPHEQVAEAKLYAQPGKRKESEFFAKAQERDLYIAMDSMLSKLERQLQH